MAKDWKQIAAAAGVEPVNESALAPLDSLESAFRPLLAQLEMTDDIAVDFAAALIGEGK